MFVLKFYCLLAVGADLPLSYSMAINCLQKLLFKFCSVEVGFSFCFLLFPSSNAGAGAGARQTSGGKTSRQDRSLSPVIGCIKSHGVKYMPSFDRRVRFTVLPVGICLLDVFESRKDLVTIK